MQVAEEGQQHEKLETEFKQRVIASSLGTRDPLLYWHMFDPDNVPSGDPESDRFTPTSPEDFAEMLERWDEYDFAEIEAPDALPLSDAQAFAKSLGFSLDSE